MSNPPASQPTNQATSDTRAKQDAAKKEEQSFFKPEIVFEDFARVDLRVAKILEAEAHPNADKLLRLQLDDGSGTPRQICAGIRGAYTPEELVGRLIVIVANLAPRTIRGEESRGMLLAGSDQPDGPDGTRRVVLLSPMSDLAPGSIAT